MNEIARGQFSKITETACLSGSEFKALPVRRLRNPPLKLNEYLLNVLNRPRPWSSLRARSVSSFCDFRKMTSRD